MVLNVLIVFPHGLGDFVHLSGVFSQYKKIYKNNIYFAIRDNQLSSKLYSRYDFISGILPIPNPLNRYFFKPRYDYVNKVISQFGIFFDEIINIQLIQKTNINAIEEVKTILKVEREVNTKPYFPLKEKEIQIGKVLEKKYFKSNKKLRFFKHLTSSALWKNKKIGNLKSNSVVIEKNYMTKDWPIGVSAYLMSVSNNLELVDSVMLHIAGALNLKIDLGYLTQIVSKGGYKEPPGLKVKKIIEKNINLNRRVKDISLNRIRIFLRALIPYFKISSPLLIKAFHKEGISYYLLKIKLNNIFNSRELYKVVVESDKNKFEFNINEPFNNKTHFKLVNKIRVELFLSILSYILNSYD